MIIGVAEKTIDQNLEANQVKNGFVNLRAITHFESWYIGPGKKLHTTVSELHTRQTDYLDIKGFAFQKGTVIGVHIDLDMKTIAFSYNLGTIQ